MATQKKNKIKIKDLPAGKKAKGVKGGGALNLKGTMQWGKFSIK